MNQIQLLFIFSIFIIHVLAQKSDVLVIGDVIYYTPNIAAPQCDKIKYEEISKMYEKSPSYHPGRLNPPNLKPILMCSFILIHAKQNNADEINITLDETEFSIWADIIGQLAVTESWWPNIVLIRDQPDIKTKVRSGNKILKYSLPHQVAFFQKRKIGNRHFEL